MDNPRLETLKTMLKKDPDDSFARYAVGLEYASNNELEKAAEVFEQLIGSDSNYHAAYYQLGKIYEKLGEFDKAHKIYEKGIYVTASQSEFHAKEELESALDELS